MFQVVATGSALAATSVFAQSKGPNLEESDPQATALGYQQDTTKVNPKKYSQARRLANLREPPAVPRQAEGSDRCPLFAGKRVAANGWCSGQEGELTAVRADAALSKWRWQHKPASPLSATCPRTL